jgi:hypothetical protein
VLTILQLGDLSALLRHLAENVLHLVGVVKLAGLEACKLELRMQYVVNRVQPCIGRRAPILPTSQTVSR